MFAVISLGNQQFKVEKDQVFLAQKTPNEIGIDFDTHALLISEDNKVHIGTPVLNNSKVVLRVLEELRGEKIHGFKYKKRKNYHKSWGHRQDLQKFQVISISAG
ncbi:MAG: 50S ribosomal protein L21 [Leptospiraceae bacterium]|nr:50S ribosomal protein L21 [Leptospiraceae bacterium]MCP5494227.1 50S ribosomal protein L21 [Leptospiraceae bacterium]